MKLIECSIRLNCTVVITLNLPEKCNLNRKKLYKKDFIFTQEVLRVCDCCG